MRILVASVGALSAFFLASCSGGASGGSSTSPIADSAAAQSNATADKASYSALIDGARVSGGPIDGLQQQNAAHTVPRGAGGTPDLLFYLSNMVPGQMDSPSHSFRIELPKAEGASSNAHMGLTLNLGGNHTARYSTSNAQITITGMTAARLTGTFSGTMKLSPDTPNEPKTTITVSDGKFDIPMATSNIIPP
jgi:hypothetical protein